MWLKAQSALHAEHQSRKCHCCGHRNVPVTLPWSDTESRQQIRPGFNSLHRSPASLPRTLGAPGPQMLPGGWLSGERTEADSIDKQLHFAVSLPHCQHEAYQQPPLLSPLRA